MVLAESTSSRLLGSRVAAAAPGNASALPSQDACPTPLSDPTAVDDEQAAVAHGHTAMAGVPDSLIVGPAVHQRLCHSVQRGIGQRLPGAVPMAKDATHDSNPLQHMTLFDVIPHMQPDRSLKVFL